MRFQIFTFSLESKICDLGLIESIAICIYIYGWISMNSRENLNWKEWKKEEGIRDQSKTEIEIFSFDSSNKVGWEHTFEKSERKIYSMD